MGHANDNPGAPLWTAHDSSMFTVDSGKKFAEWRPCGCCWVYLAKQPLVAPCDEHLQLLEPTIEDLPPTGTRCGVPGCGKPQVRTPHGISCDNGHGGAPALEDGDVE